MKQAVCPVPIAWARMHRRLLKAWERNGDGTMPRPPVPLILSGWWHSSDFEKQQRWRDTLAWAERYGFSQEIPALQEHETHFAEMPVPTTSPDSDTDWRSLILGLLGRNHDLPGPLSEGIIMRCAPFVPYNAPDKAVAELLSPIWFVGPIEEPLYDVKGVVVTREELDRLLRLPLSAFRP